MPVLGICYGRQHIAQQLGGRVTDASVREYGFAVIRKNERWPLFDGLDEAAVTKEGRHREQPGGLRSLLGL